MSNEVINASHLLPDPKCTCSRFGFPGEYPGTFLFLFVICELIFLIWTTFFSAQKHYLELWTKQAHSLKEGKLRTYLKNKKQFWI
jgi:hypothetical protein